MPRPTGTAGGGRIAVRGYLDECRRMHERAPTAAGMIPWTLPSASRAALAILPINPFVPPPLRVLFSDQQLGLHA